MARMKYYGAFNPKAAVKALKAGNQVSCKVSEDGSIYVCNGYVLFKMTAWDYQHVVQPFSCREAGNWTIDKNGKRDGCPDFEQLFKREVEAVKNSGLMQKCPLQYADGGKKNRVLNPFYDRDRDYVSFFDSVFVDAFNGCRFSSQSSIAPAVVYDYDDPVGVILPVRVNNGAAAAAVKVYFEYAEQQEEKAS